MALSVQSLANALGKQVVTESCDLCRANHRLDVHRIAIGMREATISWTRGLKSSEELFKSYGLHSGLDHPGTEEASLAALKNRSGGTLASVPPSQRQHVPQISPSSPASNGDFPMHTAGRKEGRQTKPLSAKLRMEMVPQEREAEHKRRIWELQAQTDLDDAGISAGGEDDNEEDANDEHIDFYLDDDSISVSERTRPLTYVSPHRSHNKSNSSAPQTPSLLGPLKVYALPAIPPVSPLHFAEFGFLADPADYSHRFSGLTDGQHDAFPSEPSEKAAETAPEGDPDGDLFGPAYRGSSGIATHVGPEIQAVAPPRPARVPVRCVTHGVKKQNGCQRCEVVTFWEIGLKPGEHMCSPAPEPEQF
ncbi:uncharacterized protein GLRG_02647 [Colletotrichum graminicola M1.001]|uniref:Uncharacterized protein n=1 Tax=Colletotrichum graminicola (strain M1.001 / M2 / FGSC 10212) TaxID=645133 RepID=E3Q7I9_COLGM|nr:uncharacterized protein GLRG_02647 [Colletotrichum graminicola M1.001]EFQ26827.1 hypothetical protein GLRG_02647 [Colletotrichum graminicola M1.001]